ncbi:MAG: GNAT family N-acetyltransferase [Rhizobiales bacterium]|nr:GNAT family N-acetyltransferase [Hyphomicrobiales bacterium]
MASKASHGYDAAFMEACRVELTVDARVLASSDTWVAEVGGVGEGAMIAGFAGFEIVHGRANVTAMFVDPAASGRGIGRALWTRLEEQVAARGLEVIDVEADPNAVGFYRRMGCVQVGMTPSGSIPGRMLPLLERRLTKGA